MIECEGYKAFYGTMLIRPKTSARAPFIDIGHWLYKPEYDCWYCNGHSYSAEICEVEDDKTVISSR